MTHQGGVDVAEWRHSMGMLADRFENEVHAIVGRVVVAAAEVEVMAARLCGAAETVGRDHASASAAAAAQVSAGLHSIAVSAEELSRSVDAVVRQMIGASRLARCDGAAGARREAGDVDRLLQAVLLTREIDTMVIEVAGLTNLLAMTLTIEAVPTAVPGDDLAAAAVKVRGLADRAVQATEEIAWAIAEIQQRVAQATAAIPAASPAAARYLPGSEVRAA